MVEKEHNYSIQFLRFLFTMFICYGHLPTVTMLSNIEEYSKLAHYISGCFIAVPFFFIMSGFFLPCSLRKNVETFVQCRILRLWPVMAFSIAIYGVLKLSNLPVNGLNSLDLATILFLQCTGVSQEGNANGVVWFVCVLFWTSLIYFLYLKIIKQKSLQIIFLIIFVLITGFIYVKYMPYKSVRDVVYDFMSIGMLCGLVYVGFGVLLYYLNNNLNKLFGKYLNFKTTLLPLKIIYSVIAISIFAIICVFSLYSSSFMPYPLNPVLISLLFGILFLLFINKSDILSYIIFNHKLFDFLGNTSYSVYVMQSTIFVFIYYFCITYPDFIRTHVSLVLVLSMLLFNFAGYFAYFVIEKPVLKLYKFIKGENNG